MQAASTCSGRTKYDDASASQYQERPRRQHAAEMALVDRAFSSIAKDAQVLDLPCGAHRVGLHLAKSGYDVVCADLSPAMLTLAWRAFLTSGVSSPVERQDIEVLTYDDRRFDAVLCFRLFHHFPEPGVRQRTVAELCRVARRYVALSYFSPWSPTSLKRRLRRGLGGRPAQKYATPLSEVEAYFAAHGFRLVQDFARSRLIHTLHVALFERAD